MRPLVPTTADGPVARRGAGAADARGDSSSGLVGLREVPSAIGWAPVVRVVRPGGLATAGTSARVEARGEGAAAWGLARGASTVPLEAARTSNEPVMRRGRPLSGGTEGGGPGRASVSGGTKTGAAGALAGAVRSIASGKVGTEGAGRLTSAGGR